MSSQTATPWPTQPATPPPGARLVADIADVDLLDGATFLDGPPHKAFDELRRNGGIAWHTEPPAAETYGDSSFMKVLDSPGFWAVTAHHLVAAVDRDQDLFSSEAGGTFVPSLAEESLLMFRQMMLNMDHPGTHGCDASSSPSSRRGPCNALVSRSWTTRARSSTASTVKSIW